MSQHWIPALENASFSDFVRTRFFLTNSSAIVGNYWSPFTLTLYLAVREKDGHVAAWVYEDRGRRPKPKEGPVLQVVGETSEDEGPVHIHCPPEFLAALSPARTRKAQVWRNCCINWFKHYRILLEATAEAPPGGKIKLFPPNSSTPRFSAEVNQFGGFSGDHWPDTLTLVRCLSTGYAVLVEPASAGEGKA